MGGRGRDVVTKGRGMVVAMRGGGVQNIISSNSFLGPCHCNAPVCYCAHSPMKEVQWLLDTSGIDLQSGGGGKTSGVYGVHCLLLSRWCRQGFLCMTWKLISVSTG